VFDHVEELVWLLRLLRVTVDAETLLDENKLCAQVTQVVSYFAGAPDYTYPAVKLHYKICHMSKFQTKWYRAEVQAERSKMGNIRLKPVGDSFFSKSRARSNIVFARGLSGTDGLPKMTKDVLRRDLATYSCKFPKLIRKLQQGKLSFVYTSFSSFGGIKTIQKCLNTFGWRDFRKHGVGPKRYAIWTGEQTAREKDAIRKTFNDPANDGAKQIQCVIGSPAMKEGVSLLRVRHVHAMEPYWNNSRMEQIYGRAIRFCSHKSLPRDDRSVDIYLYIAVTADVKSGRNFRKLQPEQSVDAYIVNISDEKIALTNKVLGVMIDCAADRGLNQSN
jgi:hypothetical protein